MGVLAAVLLLSIICVVLFLVAGVISFAHADARLRDRSNLFMRLRVLSQGVAIVLFALLVYFTR